MSLTSNWRQLRVKTRWLQYLRRFSKSKEIKEIPNLVVGMPVKKSSEKYLRKLDVLLVLH